MTLTPSVSLVEDPQGYPVLDIRHRSVSGRAALNGAHVLQWTPEGERPVLYMSPDALFEAGKPVRGGVPVCWPWFGPHPGNPTLPAHGFARLVPWTVDAVTEDSSGVTLHFLLRESETTLNCWPHRFELRLEVRLGKELDLVLQARNTGETPWEMSGALHTYLGVEDARMAQVLGLEESHYVESRLSPRRVIQEGPVVFDREVDRNYESAGAVTLVDPAGGRTLVVTKNGSGSTVVWNPWIEKSIRLPDLPDDAYSRFVCVEAAITAPAVVLPPGGTHALSQRLSLRSA